MINHWPRGKAVPWCGRAASGQPPATFSERVGRYGAWGGAKGRWWRVRYAFLMVILFFASGPVAEGEGRPTPGVEPSLVRGEVERDGRKVPLLGVKFSVSHPWHFYWLYSGPLGRPTVLRASHPRGLGLRSLWWEVPHKFRGMGQPETYGYERDALIGLEFAAASSEVPLLTPEDAITVSVSWAACNPEMCVPGKTELSGNFKDLPQMGMEKLREVRASASTPPSISFTVPEGTAGDSGSELVAVLPEGVLPKEAKIVDWFPAGGVLSLAETGVITLGTRAAEPGEKMLRAVVLGGAPSADTVLPSMMLVTEVSHAGGNSGGMRTTEWFLPFRGEVKGVSK